MMRETCQIGSEKIVADLSSVQELSKELEAIISSSYDGMFITDSAGVVLRVNDAYERITGIQSSEILGKNMKNLITEGYFDESVTLLVIEKRTIITINQTVKGDHKILVTGNPIFDEQGELFRVVTNVRDITELTDLQCQLMQTQEQTLKYKAELSHLRSLQIQDKDLISRSSKMMQIIDLAMKVSGVDSTVLIHGESGTGKEVIAKCIHKYGKGAGKPFIKINCVAIPEQLLESELFGYEEGAFTGAKKEGKVGLFELAQNGTLFLDEIGDLPLLLQVKLLRAIQEKNFMRVGGTKTISINARIIAATHRNLTQMIKEMTFREDLYYRLAVVPIYLPPLRERKEDIPLLIMHFIEKFNQRFQYNKKIASSVICKLVDYSWPGNVRELENVIERMIVMAPHEEITIDVLPEAILHRSFLPRQGTKLKDAVAQTEVYVLNQAYKEYGCWQKVADVLALNRATIFRKVAKYGLGKKIKSQYG
jgi:PAS domain S-box-containing protein